MVISILDDRGDSMGEVTNKEIARILQELADLMEINGENKYKIRAYTNAGLAREI